MCDRWATQTTAKDIAQQNSEVTVSWGGGGVGAAGLAALMVEGLAS